MKETEQEIERIRRRRREIVTDKVRGSSYDFPFGQISYTVRGIPYDAQDSEMLDRKERILEERKAAAEAVKMQVEEWDGDGAAADAAHYRYKVFEGITWEEVAQEIGRKATGEGIRKELDRFMTEK